MATPAPPSPFVPETAVLPAGSMLYRVHTARRSAATFNPGVGAPTRFGFFGDPVVPVLYAAAEQEAAVAETLFHDIPLKGGLLPYEQYADTVMSRLEVTRPMRLAVLHGLGLRRLEVTAEEVTASGAATYPDTVKWAEAAHSAGYDGLVWMSRLCNDTRAYVLFGDRCADAVTVDQGFARVFATGADLLWLVDLAAPLGIDVLPHGS